MGGLLEGVKVLEIGFLVAGPGATRLLADYGAQVVKVEPPSGDVARYSWRLDSGIAVQYETFNRGKMSVSLDLNTPVGREVLQDLIRWSDITLTNMRPHFLNRIGLDWDTFHRTNPAAVLGVVTTFGLDSELSDAAGGDIVAQAESGVPGYNGEEGGSPVIEMGSPADGGAAAYMFGCLLAAYIDLKRTGIGRLVDLSILDAYITLDVGVIPSILATKGEFDPGRCGRFHPKITPHGVYRASRGWIVISAYGSGPNGLWPRLARAMGREDLADAPGWETDEDRTARRDEVTALIESWLATFDDDDEPAQIVRNAGVVCSRVFTPEEALESSRRRGRLIQTVQHPVAGPVEVIGIPALMSGFDFHPTPAPALGEHSASVLAEFLGYSPERIEALKASGVVITGSHAA